MTKQEKQKARWQRWYQTKGKAYNKAYYKKNKPKMQQYMHDRYIKDGLNQKMTDFKQRCNTIDPNLTKTNLLQKFGAYPVCYLTGVAIDLEKSNTYSLDHIVPISRGGDSSLANCGLTTRLVNQAKHNLTVTEFLTLCQAVVEKGKRDYPASP
jgi:5-methylcytosine-specific restriction endonuclease McrA